MTEELFRKDAYLKECEAQVVRVDDQGIVLDRTVFYPMGGGQPGDRGVLELLEGGEPVPISDTRKADDGAILHVPAEPIPDGFAGSRVRAVIDWERRYRLMRTHTLLHLLCALIPAGVTGGSVREGTGRLDFDLPESNLDKVALSEELNRLVAEDHGVRPRWISDEELEAQPELVRTMSVKPPMGQGQVRLLEIEGVDLQPCGGTHVRRTGEIGRVAVRKIESKGRQNRRIVIEFDE
ncbi:MAG: alanyl-tRNA editing protein [Gammaproteobacteria bacterium]|nr:alanyl-tRNA editing protein [Gammaproteobacteria bacterium]